MPESFLKYSTHFQLYGSFPSSYVLSIGHLIRAWLMVIIINYKLSIVNYVSKRTSGGYCGRVPPLPIPNREVKPACADGTAMQCGRVGSRLLSKKRSLENESFRGFFVVCIRHFRHFRRCWICRKRRIGPDVLEAPESPINNKNKPMQLHFLSIGVLISNGRKKESHRAYNVFKRKLSLANST